MPKNKSYGEIVTENLVEDVSSGGEYLDREGMLSEYRTAVEGFSLEVPEGFVFSETVYADNPDDMKYPAGAGELAAYFAWIEAIEYAIIHAHENGDNDTATRLLTVASEWPNTEVYKKFNDFSAETTWFDDIISPALKGNFEPLRNLTQYDPEVSATTEEGE